MVSLLPPEETLYRSIVVLIFIPYFFIYLVKLLGVLDTPFQVTEQTMDDVSLFLLSELDGWVGCGAV
ncbi:MAG: hypothetical protein ACRDKB_10755 [Actinomycetota bacterium]